MNLFFARAQTACLHLFRNGTVELRKTGDEEEEEEEEVDG
jgi:hypothetical protein